LTFGFVGTGGNQLDILNGDALNVEDDNAHIIADGIYNAYVDYDFASDHQSTNIRRRNSSQTLVIDSIAKGLKADGTVIDASVSGTQFTGRLSNYHTITASTIPIYSNNFKVHFLNPSARDGGRHFSDFAISVTSKEPYVDSTDNNKLKFEADDGSRAQYSLYDELFQEYSSEGAAIEYTTKADRYEWDPGYSDMFMVDNRIPRPSGDDSGYVSAVKGEVRVVDYPVSSIDAGTGNFNGQWKITFTGGAPAEELFTLDGSNNVVSQSTEIGVGSVGLGIYYTTVPVLDSNGSYFAYVDGDPTDSGNRTVTAIQTKTVSITHDWQLDPALNGDSFTRSKAVKFNAQPLYLVVALKDNAKVNNIIVEEFTPDSVRTHTPKFIKGDEAPNLSIVGSGTSSDILSPAAFQSIDRLSSVRFDDQCLNPLRPGIKIYSLFLQGGVPEKFDLSNIFNRDRKGLARGLLNNKAIYLTGSAVDGTSVGNVEVTLTVKEQ
jgi:hypothetical protein